MPEKITVSGDNITLDLLLWRRFGVRGQGLVEETLDLNRDLARIGLVLPPGTVVTLPDLPPQPSPPPRRVISLFG